MNNLIINFEQAFAAVSSGATIAEYMSAMTAYVGTMPDFMKKEDGYKNISLNFGSVRLSAAYVITDEFGNILVFDRSIGPTDVEVSERYDAHGAIGPNFHSHVTKWTTPEQRNLYSNVSVLSFNKVPGYAIEHNGGNVVIMDVFNIVVPNGVLETCVDEKHRLMTADELIFSGESVTSKLRLYLADYSSK